MVLYQGNLTTGQIIQLESTPMEELLCFLYTHTIVVYTLLEVLLCEKSCIIWGRLSAHEGEAIGLSGLEDSL